MAAYLEDDAGGYDARQSRVSGKALEIKPTPENTYKAEIEEFIAAILEKRKPANNAAIGLQSQKVLAACYKSALNCKTINVK